MKCMVCPQCGKEMEHADPILWECGCGCTVCTVMHESHKPMSDEEIMERTILDNGPAYETIVAIEEMSELTKALTKDWRDQGDDDNLAEEIADVEICLGMLKMIYDNAEAVETQKLIKMQRLKEALLTE